MSAQDGLTAEGAAKLTVPLLRDALAARGLPTSGLKAELVARLKEALQAPAPAADAAPADTAGLAQDAEPMEADVPPQAPAEPPAVAAPAPVAPPPAAVEPPAPAPAQVRSRRLLGVQHRTSHVLTLNLRRARARRPRPLAWKRRRR